MDEMDEVWQENFETAILPKSFWLRLLATKSHVFKELSGGVSPTRVGQHGLDVGHPPCGQSRLGCPGESQLGHRVTVQGH